MTEGFSGEPVTVWEGSRNMRLREEIFYIDPDGKKWFVPANSFLNGATIPRPLWSAIGSPFAGKYRRASVIHDYYVGEGDNPDVTPEQRKAADRMFYHACRYDGCSRRFASMLYVGVRTGSFLSNWAAPYRDAVRGPMDEAVRQSLESDYILSKYWEIIDEAGPAVDEGELDILDEIIDSKLGSER